jgi:SAM-dependent methyltransferase
MYEQYYDAVESSDALERERLSLLGQMTDPITTARLADLGVGTGWRCLEVGAGDGTISRWLAERVGPEGRVEVMDLDPWLPVRHGRPSPAVRRHEILEGDLEEDRYDLVHCRFVLSHLADPTRVLIQMAAAVRPGGWLIVEEADFRFSGAGDPWHPRAAKFDRVWRALRTDPLTGVAIGKGFGLRLPALVERLGFREIDHEEESLILQGGGPAARSYGLGHQLMSCPAVDSGMLTRADFKELARAYDDPSFCFIPFTFVGAWGRAPAGPDQQRRVRTLATCEA